VRPVIGVTLGDGDEPGVHAMREDYVRSIEAAHAVPVVLPAVRPEHAATIVDRIDGLLLSGGVDVDPQLYGRAPHPKLGRVNRRRDEFELALVRETLRRDLPILAICRGQQVLNVALGGTLVQDIPSEWRGGTEHDAAGERWSRVHGVELTAETKLRSILGRERLSVNSFHHQAVERVAEGLTVSARCPEDGLVEGLEAPGARFVVAVQWHPESFWNRPDSFHSLFEAHVEACRS
jgi:putative glutamine amidotransferase